jgi:hypothetical protein
MADAPRKRPWFQFHLSTAIVLMFVASGLLWANLSESPAGNLSDWGVTVHIYGWPAKVYWVTSDKTGDGFFWKERGGYSGLAMDAGAALAVLLAVAVFCEWRIRRRERRAQTPSKGTP